MTERAQPTLLAVALLALVAGCDKSPFESERADPSDRDPSTTPVTRAPELDAGFAIEHTDPLPPAGDLKLDAQRFTSLDSCVAQHAVLDPVVGDAVRSIGYDTLLRDACRVLQAISTKDTSPCSAITASALENRCTSLVAMALRDPEKCPWYAPANKALGRDPLCLAVTMHDPRVCAAASGSLATCEALATGDPSRCARASGDDLATCARDFQRERTLFAGEHDVHDTTPPSARLTIHGADSKDVGSVGIDLSASVRGGAVASATIGGPSIELTGDRDPALRLLSHSDRPHLTASIMLDSGGPKVTALVLDVPKLPELSCANAHCALTVKITKPDVTRGAPLVVTFEGTMDAPGTTYQVSLKIETFMRDVVGRAALYGGR